MLTKFLDPKNDLAFKRVFGSEKNKDILIHFLNDIFARKKNPIEQVTFLKTVQEPEIASKRQSTVDVLCQDAEGHQFIVEMQVAGLPGFEKRAQYYAAKAYIHQREKGTEYKDLKQVTFLAITDYILFPKIKKYLSHHHILETETFERHLEDFSFSFLELPKFNKEKDQLKTMTEKWTYFFKYADETREEDLDAIIGNDTIIKRAYDELSRFAWSTEDLLYYDSVDMKHSDNKAMFEHAWDEGIQEGLAKGRVQGEVKGLRKGREEGRAEGRQKRDIEIAKAMLTKGMTLDTITAVTGLSIESIKKL